MAGYADFGRLIGKNLSYWCARSEQLNKAQSSILAHDHDNLIRAIRFGLQTAAHHHTAAQLLNTLFPCFEHNHMWFDAISLFTLAVKRADTNEPARALLLNNLGAFHRLSGDAAQAIGYHQQALSVSQTTASQEQARSHFLLATAYYRNHKLALAQQHIEQADTLYYASKQDNVLLQASIKNTQGLIAQAAGAFGAARGHFERALPLWQAAGATRYQLITLNNLGMTCIELALAADAIAYFDEATVLAEQINDEVERVRILVNKSVLFLTMHAPQQALAVLLSADSKQFRRLPDLRLQAELDTNLGLAFTENGRAEESLVYLTRALQIWEQLKDEINYANTLGEIGRAHVACGDIATGKTNMRKATQLFDTLSDNYQAQQLKLEFISALKKINR